MLSFSDIYFLLSAIVRQTIHSFNEPADISIYLLKFLFELPDPSPILSAIDTTALLS